MGDPLEASEPKEPARALDRVHRAEDRREHLARAGVALGKRARIETDGEDTELDRSIIEAIKDPLAHLVRNAIDHGIEPPDERVAAGKPEEGVVGVRAYHEGGQVTIEVSDDGRGIDTAAIRAKAIEHGIVSPDQASRMTERQLIDLVFVPGYVTHLELHWELPSFAPVLDGSGRLRA